jgi:hypothetical protein
VASEDQELKHKAAAFLLVAMAAPELPTILQVL